LLLKKGTGAFLNVAAYNRHPDLSSWGSDPHVFHPERWLEMRESKVKFGVYGNWYMDFQSGQLIIGIYMGTLGAGIPAVLGGDSRRFL